MKFTSTRSSVSIDSLPAILRDNGFHIQRHDANTSVYRQSNGAMLHATAGNHQMSVKFDFAPGDIDFNGRVAT